MNIPDKNECLKLISEASGTRDTYTENIVCATVIERARRGYSISTFEIDGVILTLKAARRIVREYKKAGFYATLTRDYPSRYNDPVLLVVLRDNSEEGDKK